MDFVVGLGSSLGSREAFVRVAARVLGSDPRVEVVRLSSRYVTAPVGPSQADFVNAAARVRTELAPRALLDALLAVEASLGRVRAERWGPRTIDLDLLSWEGGEVREPGLLLPHPRLRERAFALAPLLEVAPELLGELGADLAGLGAPPASPWTDAVRIDGGLEVEALDDADALALALGAALGGGASREVAPVQAGRPEELIALVTGMGQNASVAVEELGAGGIRAWRTFDPGASPADRRPRLVALGGGRCRLALDPPDTAGM